MTKGTETQCGNAQFPRLAKHSSHVEMTRFNIKLTLFFLSSSLPSKALLALHAVLSYKPTRNLFLELELSNLVLILVESFDTFLILPYQLIYYLASSAWASGILLCSSQYHRSRL
jgi:hypothetical protein